jgi:hypothetical protein
VERKVKVADLGGSSRAGSRPALQSIPAPIRTRHSAHRRRCAAAIRALPSVVLGPVESPPWKRQRRLPGSTLTKQGRHSGSRRRSEACPFVGAVSRRRQARAQPGACTCRQYHRQNLSRFGGVLPDRRSSRADANGSNSLWSRGAAAAWRWRHQWRLGVQPPFAALPLVFAPRFGEKMSTFVCLLVKAYDAHARDALFGSSRSSCR